jgi:hypothetical protein
MLVLRNQQNKTKKNVLNLESHLKVVKRRQKVVAKVAVKLQGVLRI